MAKFAVRWAFEIEADTPDEAVRLMIQQFVENGMINWLYRVDDETGVVGYYNGHGDEYDPATGRPLGEPEEQDSVAVTPSDNGSEDLLEHARQQSNAAQPEPESQPQAD